MSADQIKKFIAAHGQAARTGKPVKLGEGVRAWLDARTKDEADGRRRPPPPRRDGLPEERLRRFPADQVILLDEKREYEVRLRRRS